jgi:cell division septal protein FtsQ
VSLNLRDTTPLDHEPEPLLARIRRIVGAGLMGGVAVTVLGLLGHEVAVGAAFEVHRVEIAGNVRASDVAVRHLANLRTGTHLSQVDLQQAVTGVQAHPWVARAEGRLLFPSGVQILVEEHEPVMLLALDQLWYVDAQGTVFRQADARDLDYPVLSGVEPSLVTEHPALARAILAQASDILDATAGHPQAGPDQLSEVRFDRRAGFTLVLRTGTELVLGFDDVDRRIDRFDRLVQAGFDPTSPNRVDLGGRRVAVAAPLVPPAPPAPAG